MTTIIAADPEVVVDVRDKELAEARQYNRLDKFKQPISGDWVEFADGTTRRISMTWNDEVQTSDGGSWFLDGGGGGSFSGSLHGPVPRTSLIFTKTLRLARFWFFHHDWPRAGNGVYVEIGVRVWKCDRPAPR